jgi:A/G-specific adenine glycosylase
MSPVSARPEPSLRGAPRWVTSFRSFLISWGREHFQPYPWRFTKNAFHVLVAEVMLHRTQARQVIPVYQRFIERYPDASSVASAPLSVLYKELYPLGLRWRVQLMKSMAAELCTEFNGHIPFSRSELTSLSGVSDYIANAVRCFAFDIPDVIVDTNTVRVVGRLLGWPTKESSRRNPTFRHAMEMLLDQDRPREYNFALLDLSHKVCHKVAPPECTLCPASRWCTFRKSLKLGNANQAR